MDQRAIVSIDIQKDGHVFSFHMPLGAQWGHAYEAAVELVQGIEKHIKELEQKASAPQETPADSEQA